MTGHEWAMWVTGVLAIIAVCWLAVWLTVRNQPDPDEQARLEAEGWCFEQHGYGAPRGMQYAIPHRHPAVRPPGHVIMPPAPGRPFKIERED